MGLYLGGDSPECESGECNFFGHIAWEFGNGVPLVLGCVPIGGLVVGLVVRLTRD